MLLSHANAQPVRTAPFLLRHTPRHAPTRQWAERAWSLYPPAALLIGALLLAAGCRGNHTASTPMASPAPEGDAYRANASVEAILYPSYPADLPLAGSADARATIRYGKDRIELINLSSTPLTGARLWVNDRYSMLLPHTRPNDIRSIHFSFLRDENGRPFPTNNSVIRIEKVELITGDERTSVRFGLGY